MLKNKKLAAASFFHGATVFLVSIFPGLISRKVNARQKQHHMARQITLLKTQSRNDGLGTNGKWPPMKTGNLFLPKRQH
jgi:hypothetical protein